MSETADTDTLLDELLGIPPPSGQPSMSDPVFQMLPLQQVARDLVRKIVPPGVVAERYGLTQPQLLLLCAQDGFKKIAKAERALWDGPDNAAERTKVYHREGQAYAASTVVNWILDENLPIAARMDAAKLSARIAGVDTPPKAETGSFVAQAGATFAVNIHFSDKPAQRISTTVEAPLVDAERLAEIEA